MLQSLSVTNIIDRLQTYHIDEYKYNVIKETVLSDSLTSRRLKFNTKIISKKVKFTVRLFKLV